MWRPPAQLVNKLTLIVVGSVRMDTCVRFARSAGYSNRKQHDGDVDHVTLLPRRRHDRELEHDDTGYHSLPRSTPVDARPAAAVENEASAGNASGGYGPTRPNVDNFTYTLRRNDVGNYRTSSSTPGYRYIRYWHAIRLTLSLLRNSAISAIIIKGRNQVLNTAVTDFDDHIGPNGTLYIGPTSI